MSPKSKEELHRFEQKMHDKGSDGFADGPRPWEHWDESGNQANSRVWEGSARRIYGSRGAHSLGHRLLSLLAFLALATLLVGIGGVYYTHMQTQQIAQEDIRIQPLPITDRTRSVSPAAEPVASKKIIRDVDELNVMTAPAAGSGSASTTPVAADAEMAGVDSEVATAPPVDATAVPALAVAGTASEEPEAVSASEPTPPPADSNIDSVSIETVVTEKSVTTTVYTRHPQQDKPEVIAAIETTPPPFAHEVAPAAGTAAADASSATVDQTAMASDEASGDALADVATGIEADSPAGAETGESQDTLTLTSLETEPLPGDTTTTDSTSMTEDSATVASTGMEAGADEATTLTPTAAPRDAAVPAPSETQADIDESAVAAAAVTVQDTAVPAPSETEADVDESAVAAAVAAQDTAALASSETETDVDESAVAAAAQNTAVPAPSETEADVDESAMAAAAVTAQDTAAITAPTEADADEAATAAEPEPAPEETAAETPVAEETTQIALAESASPVEDTTPAETAQASTAVKQPIMPVARQGDWVINLASYTWKSTANKKLALFKDKGVDAEVFRVMINDKPMYRVRVTGFESSRAARAEVASIEQTLDLEGAWVARR